MRPKGIEHPLVKMTVRHPDREEWEGTLWLTWDGVNPLHFYMVAESSYIQLGIGATARDAVEDNASTDALTFTRDLLPFRNDQERMSAFEILLRRAVMRHTQVNRWQSLADELGPAITDWGSRLSSRAT